MIDGVLGALPPGAVLILGAMAAPLLRGRALQGFLLALPVLSFLHLVSLPGDLVRELALFDYTLAPVRIDRLSLPFGYIFHIAAFLMTVYALHVRDRVQHTAALIYMGATIGAVFAGDLVTLFVYWELTAVTSVFLIWTRRNRRSYRAGMRYLVIQVGSGVLLLAGIIFHSLATGSIAFERFASLDGPGAKWIFLAFGIKCAFPLLHNWLQDAYPEATVTGTVFLSAFTTKLAVYALARAFPGVSMLVWIGAIMTVVPIFYAVIENDLRRVLAYSLMNQLGFMVVGIGIGTEMALNGTVAHAFAHILYKALLFMSMGAVLMRAGTVKGSELGGLYKSMPWTCLFCCVGAASISAFPFFSGFVTKSLVLTAAADGHYVITWFVLLFASAGVFHHSGIKIPFFAFFAHDSGIRCREAPGNMLLAMGATAFLCVFIGVFPAPLYSILPFPVDYRPYTPTHVLTQYQLLMFSALAFAVLVRTGLYPRETPSVNLDTDWIYRRLGPALTYLSFEGLVRARRRVLQISGAQFGQVLWSVYYFCGPRGLLARTWLIGVKALMVAIALAAFLLILYLA